jgi:APA family basic amino acid/polyamine antiporter
MAWIVGWDLMVPELLCVAVYCNFAHPPMYCFQLEYGVSAAAVATGFSKYLSELLLLSGTRMPLAISSAPIAYSDATGAFSTTGAVLDLPAVLLVVTITIILIVGVKESTYFNVFIVSVKMSVVLLVIILGFMHIKSENFSPFAPYGWFSLSLFGFVLYGDTAKNKDGSDSKGGVGVLAGAALVFFAYIGFDSVSTNSEDAIEPQR